MDLTIDSLCDKLWAPELSTKLRVRRQLMETRLREFRADKFNQELKQSFLEMAADYDYEVAVQNGIIEVARGFGIDKDDNAPFLFNGWDNNNAIILVHGLRSSPWQMKELGEILAEEGYTVYGVRLAGHGVTDNQLRFSQLKDWYGAVEYAYGVLRICEYNVGIVGSSTGAALSLSMAANNSDIKCVASLAAPIKIQKEVRILFRYLLRIAAVYVTPKPRSEGEDIGHYNIKIGIKALGEFQKAREMCRQSLQYVTQPVLIGQALDDKVVQSGSATMLEKNLGSKDITVEMYPNGGHILPKASCKEKVFSHVLCFLNEHMSKKHRLVY